VGAYSAGAVLSIAFDKPYPIVDANVNRVYARIFLLGGDLASGAGKRRVWEAARKMLDERRPGDFNQALMELGAILCAPEDPDCASCPVRAHCRAYQKGVQDEYPWSRKPHHPVEVRMAAALAMKDGKVLIRKRPEGSRWLKGLWEFPNSQGRTFAEARLRLEKETGLKFGRKALKVVRHQITHHRIRLALFQTKRSKAVRDSRTRWIPARKLGKFPFSSAQGKLCSWLEREFLHDA
jgi:A/G-specific adenine glycosylase